MNETVRWGVVGVGIAGRARGRAIAADPRCGGSVGWRGDPAAAGLAAVDSLAALLARVDAVAVCSRDDSHAELVRAALEADKHVVCEFPLAPTAAEARALFDLAAARGRVLHVEHIELLTPQARWLRGRVAGRALVEGAVRFQGAHHAWQGSVALANIARLHRLVDLFGLPEDVAVTWRDDSTLQAVLAYPFDRSRVLHPPRVELSFRRGEGLRRRTELALEVSDGTVVQLDQTVLDGGLPVALPAGPGLFAADHALAMDRILHDTRPNIDPARIVAVLALAERLAAG